jgi:hypothetical protein
MPAEAKYRRSGSGTVVERGSHLSVPTRHLMTGSLPTPLVGAQLVGDWSSRSPLQLPDGRSQDRSACSRRGGEDDRVERLREPSPAST